MMKRVVIGAFVVFVLYLSIVAFMTFMQLAKMM